jgi:Ca2+-binding RTX toxin-like protein
MTFCSAAVVSDTLDAGEGVNALVGDEGTVTLQDGVVTEVQTQPGSNDGEDALTSGAGDDILLGGGGSDTLNAGDGVNALVGDEGEVTLQDGVIEQVVTQAGDNDGDDALTSGAGDDILPRRRWFGYAGCGGWCQRARR